MSYEISIATRRGYYRYGFEEYTAAHRAFFKYYRKAQRYCPGSVSMWLRTTGYDEVEGTWLMTYAPDEGLTINYAANEHDVY